MKRPRTLVYERPSLYPKQEAAFFCRERYGIVEAGTKVGKTTGGIVWLVEQAVLTGAPGRRYWWVAPVLPQALMAYERMKSMLPREWYVARAATSSIWLPNDATIWFKSADAPDSLFGEDVYAVVIDEASRCKEDAWHAIRTTLTATGGPVRMVGNVKGRRNWMFHVARRAEAGMPNMHFARLTADDAIDAGLFDRSELEDATRLLPTNVLRELYFAEASDDGGNPFGLDAVHRSIQPLSTAPPVVWGWDLAKSHDWTVGVALDAAGVVCQFKRFQRPWSETIEIIRALTCTTPALIDSTGVGDPVVEQLQQTQANVAGWRFTSASKQQLMERLALALQQGQLGIPEGLLVQELEVFEYEYTRTGVRYSAPPGFHDDCVCALALAVHQYAMEFNVVPLHLMGKGVPPRGNGLRQVLDMCFGPPVSRAWRMPQADDGLDASNRGDPERKSDDKSP